MLKVISASRRVDLVGAYPGKFIELLREKAPPEKTHTLVIWTKNPANILGMPDLRKALAGYRSLFLHLTVTGMGGTQLEPGIPPSGDVLAMLLELVAFTGGPEHIRLRFDPIVHVRMPDGSVYTNLGEWRGIAEKAASAGIRDVSISWMQVYRKVERRLDARGMAAVELSEDQMRDELGYLLEIAESLGIRIHGCCVPLLPVSRCIDGELLSRIHPDKLPCSKARAAGQRPLCGCTKSLDIGWYEPCAHGCIYCYANPESG